MAQLKDLIVNGASRFIGDIFGNKAQLTTLNAPTSAGGTTYGPGTSGQVLKTNGSSIYWAADNNSGGTVTSVQVQATSPVVSSQNTAQTGTLNTTISLNDGYGDTKNPYASKTKNYVLAAPSAANGAPSFRALVADDIPTLSITDKTSGTLTVARGGTGNTSYTANRLIYSESTSKLSASGHYASSTKIAINSTSEPSYNFYVNGTSYITGVTTIGELQADFYGSSGSISERLTSLNFGTANASAGRTKMRLDLATNTVTEGAPPAASGKNSSGYLHTYYWDNGQAMTQLYIPNGDHVTTKSGPQPLMMRGYQDNAWQDWITIPTGTGVGASGTWGISVSGNAATATKATQDDAGNSITGTYVHKSGDTMSGALTIANGSNGHVDLKAEYIEMYGSTPFIDFHRNYSSADYTARVIAGLDGSTEALSLQSQEIILSANGKAAALYSDGSFTNWQGSIFAGDVSSTAERSIGSRAQAGTIYLYSQGSTTGSRGIYMKNSAGTDATGLTFNQNNRISDIAEFENHGIVQRYVGLSKGTNPSSDQWKDLITTYQNWGTQVSSRLSMLEECINPSGYHNLFLRSYSFDSGSTAQTYLQLVAPKGTEQGYVQVSNRLLGAAWNDYAEYRKDNEQEKDIQQPGRCVAEIGDGSLKLTTQRLERGCEIISDTFGFGIGEDKEHGYNTPIASSGRVLAYGYESREEFASHIGWPVCSGPDGTVSIMTEDEEEKYPSCIIGTISEVPDYEEWGTGNVKVDGRVWIRIR